MLYRLHLTWLGFELTTLVVIAAHCIGSYKSNYHMIFGACRYYNFGGTLWLLRGITPFGKLAEANKVQN